tara:strand:- start:11064 stop:11192 length:129 start_codon:yes stop_codon:yes gene_type:complete
MASLKFQRDQRFRRTGNDGPWLDEIYLSLYLVATIPGEEQLW